MTPILIIAEMFEGQIRQVTYELIEAAKKITDISSKQSSVSYELQNHLKTCDHIKLVVLSDSCQKTADVLAKKTGIDVIGIEAPDLGVYTAGCYIDCLDLLIKRIRPSMVIAAHSSQGRDFVPGLAIRIKACAVPGINEIQPDDQSDNNWGLIFSRPVLNSTKNMLVRTMPDVPVVLTVLPGSFAPAKQTNSTPGSVDIQKQPVSQTPQRIKHIKIKKNPVDNQGLKSAAIIVAAGQGIENKENLDWIFKLSKCFDKSAVGASRPVVDRGWLPYTHQVGITGATVSPGLYLACGISGSSQHLAGIKKAKTVISINKNPEAPICQHADLCIVEDAIEFIQAFLETKKES